MGLAERGEIAMNYAAKNANTQISESARKLADRLESQNGFSIRIGDCDNPTSERDRGHVAELIQSAIDEATHALQPTATIGRKWLTDSSLETWFPITAEELSSLRSELNDLHVKDSVRTKEYNILVQENRSLRSEVEQWKECAEKLAAALRKHRDLTDAEISGTHATAIGTRRALNEFTHLKGQDAK